MLIRFKIQSNVIFGKKVETDIRGFKYVENVLFYVVDQGNLGIYQISFVFFYIIYIIKLIFKIIILGEDIQKNIFYKM